MSVIEQAISLVHGARQESYGHPFDDFSRTGRIWGAILGIDPIPPHLVALCMIGVKVSREVNAPKPDNLIDIAGYAEALALVRERDGADRGVYTVPTVTCEDMGSPHSCNGEERNGLVLPPTASSTAASSATASSAREDCRCIFVGCDPHQHLDVGPGLACGAHLHNTGAL